MCDLKAWKMRWLLMNKWFQVVPMQEKHAAEVCSWRYDPPYDIYSWLPWEQMQALEVEFGDAQLRSEQYVSILDEGDELVGFAQYFPLIDVTRLGIGMKPDLCGYGYGHLFVSAIVEEALRRAPRNTIDLEVLTWNKRAIRCYEHVGFSITDEYDKMTPKGVSQTFYCMVFQGFPR